MRRVFRPDGPYRPCAELADPRVGAVRRFGPLVLLAAGCVLAILAPAGARADVEGPACVEDGNTLVIDGHRSYRHCRGGTPVVLFGIDAPDLKQTCEVQGTSWDCGRQAAATLLNLTRGKTVTCVGESRDREDRLVAVCHAGGVNLNQTMVRFGLAVSVGARYALDEGAARSARAGMWMGTFERPSEWRESH